jgi:ABC-type nitrate/sulfonate/bicarbonate transport system permease component
VRALLRQAAYAVALPIVLVAVWWWVSADSVNYFVPPLARILEVFPATWNADRITGDVLPSLGRLVVGYLLALVLGVAVGAAIGLSRTVRALCEPTLEFFRAIPPPVIVPVIALFVGYTGSTAKVVAIAFGCLWPILLNTVEGVRGLDEVLIDTARCYRFRSRTRLLHVVLRGASPQVAAGARQALSIGVIMMVISEIFGASRGLGATVVQFQRSFAVPEMWTGIILLGLIGVLLSVVFRVVEHYAMAWYRGLRRADRGA